jgi:hypothetical protein
MTLSDLAGRGLSVPDAAALRADCQRCAAVCCVALTLTRSADFAIDKPAGTPCPNLAPDHRCRIHARLRVTGFAGCTAYDCFGAGQRVTAMFGGRESPDLAAMSAALPVVRQLHELLHYLADARSRTAAAGLYPDLDAAVARVAGVAADPLLDVDVAAERAAVDVLLQQVSDLVRAEVPGRRDHRRADLVGASLPGADLRGADLRGAYLIGADLREADLGLADLIGADLRDCDLRGAQLATSLFLTQMQVSAARGDEAATIPEALSRPAHWCEGAAVRGAPVGDALE